MFVIKICHSYEQFYITVTKKKLSYEMHQYDKQCLLLLQIFFISVVRVKCSFSAPYQAGAKVDCTGILIREQGRGWP